MYLFPFECIFLVWISTRVCFHLFVFLFVCVSILPMKKSWKDCKSRFLTRVRAIRNGIVDAESLAYFDARKDQRLRTGEDQLEWLENTLRSSTADFLIVCGHYPVFSGGEHGNTASLLTKVCDILPALPFLSLSVFLMTALSLPLWG